MDSKSFYCSFTHNNSLDRGDSVTEPNVLPNALKNVYDTKGSPQNFETQVQIPDIAEANNRINGDVQSIHTESKGAWEIQDSDAQNSRLSNPIDEVPMIFSRVEFSIPPVHEETLNCLYKELTNAANDARNVSLSQNIIKYIEFNDPSDHPIRNEEFEVKDMKMQAKPIQNTQDSIPKIEHQDQDLDIELNEGTHIPMVIKIHAKKAHREAVIDRIRKFNSRLTEIHRHSQFPLNVKRLMANLVKRYKLKDSNDPSKDLVWLRALRIEDIKSICPEIMILILDNLNLTNANLSAMKEIANNKFQNLLTLSLSNTNIQPAHLQELLLNNSIIENLEELDISHNDMTDFEFDTSYFQTKERALSKLKILNMSSVRLNKRSKQLLFNFLVGPSVVKLNLSNNKLTDEDLELILAKCLNLEELCVSRNYLTESMQYRLLQHIRLVEISENYPSSNVNEANKKLNKILSQNHVQIIELNKHRKFGLENEQEEIDKIKMFEMLNAGSKIFKNLNTYFLSNKLAKIVLYGSKDKVILSL